MISIKISINQSDGTAKFYYFFPFLFFLSKLFIFFARFDAKMSAFYSSSPLEYLSDSIFYEFSFIEFSSSFKLYKLFFDPILFPVSLSNWCELTVLYFLYLEPLLL